MNSLLDTNPQEFLSALGRRPLWVNHQLVGHPLLSLEALAALAASMPPDRVERQRTDLDLVLPGGGNPRGGVESPGDLVRGIETGNDWVVLWNVENDPRYKALLDEILDPIAALLGDREGGMCRREAFIFISSAASITPVHFDPEHNFLLQIHGVKQMHIGQFATVTKGQRELERYYIGGHRNIEHMPEEADVFGLEPGRGVYVPSHAPHWVANEGVACVSLSITFHTREILRRGNLHVVNHHLRRLGLSPSLPDRSKVVDAVKLAFHRVASTARNLRRRIAESRQP
jgi:hypothetical protein